MCPAVRDRRAESPSVGKIKLRTYLERHVQLGRIEEFKGFVKTSKVTKLRGSNSKFANEQCE